MLIGCLADDMTGACDLALMLAANGMRTRLSAGIPERRADGDADAVVIALKTRTSPAAQAVDESLRAMRWLLAGEVKQIYFKYCSTFDSTREGNIGPVCEALLDELDEPITILCPAFPANGRTVVNGVLYVDDVPLAESSMRHHPLTPMTESSVVRLMNAQTRDGQTGVVDRHTVARGSKAVRACVEALRSRGFRYAVTDASNDDDLVTIAAGCGDMRLVTGGSGLAMGLPAWFRSVGLLQDREGLAEMPAVDGNTLVIAGSCSMATRRQVARLRDRFPAVRIDPLAIAEGRQTIKTVMEEVDALLAHSSVLVYSTTDPESVRQVQDDLGVARAAELVENLLANVANESVARGVRKIIVAGGETSGAVADALGIQLLAIGPRIAPGVPWMFTTGDDPICLAFKSGNFGDDDFFTTAMKLLA